MADEKKYRTEIPNIIDDLGLSPYERALYVHYKRVCGANGGQCTEGVRGTAERTKISQGKVSSVRAQLVKRGLIRVEPFGDVGGVSITITDIWTLNFIYYSTKDRPDVDGWTVEKITQWSRGVHTVNTPPTNEEIEVTEEGNRSPDEQGCSYSEQGCSPDEHKKEPIKKEPINNEDSILEKSLSPSQKMFAVLAEVCRCNINLMRGQLNKVEKELREAGVTPETIKAFGKWWYSHDFRGKQDQPPTLKQVKETLGQFEAFRGQPDSAVLASKAEAIPEPDKPELTPAEKVLALFKELAAERIPAPQWREHIAPMRVIGCPNGKIQVEVNRFTKELIENRFNKVLEPIALKLNPEGGFEYVVI